MLPPQLFPLVQAVPLVKTTVQAPFSSWVSPATQPLGVLPRPGIPSTALWRHPRPWKLNSPIQLDFSRLKSYEVVRDQFQSWGIEFEDTIAIQPSNHAFAAPEPCAETQIALMPIAQPCMTIRLHQPCQNIKLTLAGARAILVQAFDRHHQQVAEHYLTPDTAPLKIFKLTSGLDPAEPNPAEPNQLEPSVPVHTLQLQAATFARIEITSIAPFMLQKLYYI